MYAKTAYNHSWNTYAWQHKKDLRGVISSLARSNTHPANDINIPLHQRGITRTPSEQRCISREPERYRPIHY